MANYYVRFNPTTQLVDVFNRMDDALIQSVEVTSGVVPTLDVEQIAFTLGLSEVEKADLDYAIFYEDRDSREVLDTHN